MASALDVVQTCLVWAQAKNMLKADPHEGTWDCFDAEEMQKHFAAGHPYTRVAANLFFFDLIEWAVDGQEASPTEAKKYAETHFPIKRLEEYYGFLDAKPGSPAAIVPAGKAPTFEWKVPVCAAAMGPTLPTATLGSRGTWRIISADSQVYGFLFAAATLIWKTPKSNAVKKALDMLAAMAMHCPIDVHPFVWPVVDSPQREIVLKSSQIQDEPMTPLRRAPRSLVQYTPTAASSTPPSTRKRSRSPSSHHSSLSASTVSRGEFVLEDELDG